MRPAIVLALLIAGATPAPAQAPYTPGPLNISMPADWATRFLNYSSIDNEQRKIVRRFYVNPEALAAADLPSDSSERPGFGTNGCQFAAERGLPTVIYGPSRRELVHGVDEYIEINELVGACAGYGAMAARLLSPAAEREPAPLTAASRGD